MRDRDRNAMNDTDFDAVLRNSMSDLPPDEIVSDVTPWRLSMNRILTGLALCSVQFAFLGLNILLPTIGVFLLLLGFRSLRRENSWFKACWYFTIPWFALSILTRILSATIIQVTSWGTLLCRFLGYFAPALMLLVIFCFWRGLRALRKKVGIPIRTSGAAALFLWYIILCLLALAQYSGIFLSIVILVSFVLILRSLYLLAKALEKAGYAIRTASVQVPDRILVLSLLGVLAAGLLCGYLFWNRYPMDWQPAEVSEDANVARIKADLLDLGFPEDILKDLTVEEVRECEGALRVIVESEDHYLDGSTRNLSEPKDLRVTGIAVALPGQRERWKIIYHFQWTSTSRFYGTESLELTPASGLSGWDTEGAVTGRVLYDQSGQVYAAPYLQLGNETYTTAYPFTGETTVTSTFAVFSMPDEGENHRGYLAYTVSEALDGCIINSWVQYTHQTHWMQYPVKTAKEMQMAPFWTDEGVFETYTSQLIFDPNDTN